MFFKNILDRNDFTKKKKRTNETDMMPIILVSIARADDKEKVNVFLMLGFSRKLIPIYILIIVSERKKMSF